VPSKSSHPPGSRVPSGRESGSAERPDDPGSFTIAISGE
jgi:predicted alternative tryptophan synthase beta-subunit